MGLDPQQRSWWRNIGLLMTTNIRHSSFNSCAEMFVLQFFAQSTLIYEIVVSVWLSPLMISVRNWKESTEVVARSALSISVRIPTTQTRHWKYYCKRNWMSRQIIGLYFLTSAAFVISMPKYIQGNWWPNNTVIQEVYCCFVKLDNQYINCHLMFHKLKILIFT